MKSGSAFTWVRLEAHHCGLGWHWNDLPEQCRAYDERGRCVWRRDGDGQDDLGACRSKDSDAPRFRVASWAIAAWNRLIVAGSSRSPSSPLIPSRTTRHRFSLIAVPSYETDTGSGAWP